MEFFNVKNEDRIGAFLILLPLMCYLLTLFSFMIGGGLTVYVPIISLAVCSLCLYWQTKQWSTVVFYLATFVLSIFLATIVWDRSFDGTWYHADIQNAIAFHHWNPYFHWSLCDEDMLSGYRSFFWATHYAKGIETISASWVILTNNLESGKTTNLIFLIGLFFLLHSLFNKVNLFQNKYYKYLFIFIIVGNPVFLTQLFTNYIDWTSYVFLIIIMICLYKIVYEKKKLFEIVLYLLIILVVGIKINVAFWVCLYTFLLIIFLFYKRKTNSKIPILFLCSVCIGFLLAFNPYITNYLEYGNPFYPLAGNNNVDIMTEQIPEAIYNDNLFLKVCKSFVLPTGMGDIGDLTEVSNLRDFVVSLGSYDAHVGGFGLLFFYATLLLLVLSIFSSCPNKFKYTVWLCILGLFASLFLLPSGWWARYVAFFYITPIILIPLCCYDISLRWGKQLFKLAIVMLVINSFLPLAISSVYGLYQQKRSIEILSYLEQVDTNKLEIKTANALFVEKLSKNRIKYKRNNNLGESQYIKFTGSSIYYSGVKLPNSMKGEVVKNK